MYEGDGTQTSSFHGDIAEIPEIKVDNFVDKYKNAYFLSHVHTDHTQGLYGRNNSIALHNNGLKIYMSENSNTIISHNHFNYDILKEIVEPLKIGFTYTIDVNENKSFQVTLIPATHMIGAVMFLFKIDDKNILYTGDFVIEQDDVCDIKKLHNEDGTPIKIDAMYVDATFDNDDYEHFPGRNLCHQQLAELAEDWLTEENRRLALYSNYQFGYEDLYDALYERTNIEIFLQPQKKPDIHQLYTDLFEEFNFITNDDKSKIHICKNKTNDSNHSNCGVMRSAGLDYKHVYISARHGYGYTPGDAALTQDGRSYYLCYPTHCSKTQLEYFIEYFKPQNVTKFPKKPMQTPTSRSPYRT